MENKFENLDSVIDETSKNDLKKARDLFKSSVQLLLLSKEFYIEHTMRNDLLMHNFVENKSKNKGQIFSNSVFGNGINVLKEKLVNNSENTNPALHNMLIKTTNDITNQREQIKKNNEKKENEYKEFISGFVSLNDYYYNSTEKSNKIYEKIKSGLEEYASGGSASRFLTSINHLGGAPFGNLNNNNYNLMLSFLKEANKEEIKSLLQKKPEINNLLAQIKYNEYIESKIYGRKNDLFAILDAIAAVDLELCMKELDELIKPPEESKNGEEDKKINNENKIVIDENLNPKEKKFKDIKEQLKHRAKLLGFSSSDIFCGVIDRISTESESIDEFKSFVDSCQKKFDEYQKEYGSISAYEQLLGLDQNAQEALELPLKAKKLELNIVEDFYTEAKKQAKKILDKKKQDKKNDPKILAVEFVLDLIYKHDLKVDINTDLKGQGTLHNDVGFVKIFYEEFQALAKVTEQLDKGYDFGFENLQSIVKSVASTRDLSGKLFDLDSAQKFYNLMGTINNDYSKAILKAIDTLKGNDQKDVDFWDNILNQKDKTLVSDFFAFAFNDKQDNGKKLEYTKKFLLSIVDQALKNYETKNQKNKFLSLAFGKYFNKKIEDAKTIESLNETIGSVKNFIEDTNNYLSENPQVSLDVLTENVDNVEDKDDLVSFFTSVANSASKMNNVNKYENRKLLADLKDIFLDKDIQKSASIDDTKSVVKLLKKLDENQNDVQEENFEGLSKVLSTYAKSLIKNNITKDFPLLSETLKFQCKASTLQNFTLKEKRNLIKCMTNIAKGVFTKNAQSYDENKNALKDYFWLHTIEIFGQKKFTETEAKEIYHFIEMEFQQHDDGYFKLLFKAISALNLNDGKSISEMLNQDDNFKNILTFKNSEKNEQHNAYKSILKSLVKQKLNQKGGFVSSAYLKHYEKKINDNEIKDKLQNEIVNGVNSVLDGQFQPDSEILEQHINDIKNDNDLSAFWKSCHKAEKNQVEEKKEGIITVNNETGNKDIDDKDKILSTLSDIFLDLLGDNKSNSENEINTNSNNLISNENVGNVDNKNDSDLMGTTKKFVNQLFQLNEKDKNDNITDINTNKNEEDNQVEKDNTGIKDILNRYYDKHFTKNKQNLSKITDTTLKYQIEHFHELDNDRKIKLLQCMKNVKDNKLTNDDLRYTNLYFYKNRGQVVSDSTDLTLQNMKLTIDENKANNLDQALCDFFKKSSLFKNETMIIKEKKDKDLVQYVIENIGKEKITELEDKQKFASAVMFALNEEIQNLKDAYENNDYNKIDSIEIQKEDWKKVIDALKSKDVIQEQSKKEFARKINDVDNRSGIVTALEWFLSLLASITIIGLASKTVRKTLCSPIKSRQTRHLMKNAIDKNGIFSMLHNIGNNIGNIPPQKSEGKDNCITS